MVHYVFTPWRHRRELLLVRRQFYPGEDGHWSSSAGDAAAVAAQRAAVARVALWTHRGHCPHMVESTALLVATLLTDAAATSPTEVYAVRAAYAAAFSRFVTGLLDGQQERARKMSMYSLARTIGLPAAFVELRHQATHEPLPPLGRLRAAARRALSWIWQYYWANLRDEESKSEAEREKDCRAALLRYVQTASSASTSVDRVLARYVRTWGETAVLAVLADLASTALPSLALRCIRLSQLLLDEQKEKETETPSGQQEKEVEKEKETSTAGQDNLRDTLQHDRHRVEEEQQDPPDETDRMAVDNDNHDNDNNHDNHDNHDTRIPQFPKWTRYEGDWKPKPIGSVI